MLGGFGGQNPRPRDRLTGHDVLVVGDWDRSDDGIPPDKTGQAAALINAARNTGGSIGISLISNARL